MNLEGYAPSSKGGTSISDLGGPSSYFLVKNIHFSRIWCHLLRWQRNLAKKFEYKNCQHMPKALWVSKYCKTVIFGGRIYWKPWITTQIPQRYCTNIMTWQCIMVWKIAIENIPRTCTRWKGAQLMEGLFDLDLDSHVARIFSLGGLSPVQPNLYLVESIQKIHTLTRSKG